MLTGSNCMVFMILQEESPTNASKMAIRTILDIDFTSFLRVDLNFAIIKTIFFYY